MGPIVVFDKSFLQMLNIDEAVIFDALYSSVICPIFYIEVLADPAKAPTGERTVEHLVADLARKTPIMHSTPNVLHSSICWTELNGMSIDMRHVPARAGGKTVRMADGKVGTFYDEAPEAKAFARWQREQFREIEREFASRYRQQLAVSDHGATAKLVKRILAIHSNPRDLDDALAIAKEVVHGEGQRFQTLKTAFTLLGLPSSGFPGVQRRWTAMGRPRLADFAPYTAHCLLVELNTAVRASGRTYLCRKERVHSGHRQFGDARCQWLVERAEAAPGVGVGGCLHSRPQAECAEPPAADYSSVELI